MIRYLLLLLFLPFLGCDFALKEPSKASLVIEGGTLEGDFHLVLDGTKQTNIKIK